MVKDGEKHRLHSIFISCQACQELEKIRRKLEAELADVHHQLEEAKQTVRKLNRSL